MDIGQIQLNYILQLNYRYNKILSNINLNIYPTCIKCFYGKAERND